MSDQSGNKNSFEASAHTLYGCLAQFILVFILIANIVAYIVSAKYRSKISLGKFILCILGWTALTLVFWWMRRGVKNMKGPFRPRR